MRTSLFGYNKTDVDTTLTTLKQENEQLNATITTLNTQIKNGDGNNAKTILLETTITGNEDTIRQLQDENEHLKAQLSTVQVELSIEKEKYTELILNPKVMESNMNVNTNVEDTQKVSSLALEPELLDNNKSFEQLETTHEEQVAEVALTREATISDDLTSELELCNEKVQSLQDELAASKEQIDYYRSQLHNYKEVVDASKIQLEEYDKLKLLDQHNEQQRSIASDISLRSFCDMSKIHNDVIESIHDLMKNYYKYVNDQNAQIRLEMEQCQLEYRKMIQSFIIKAYEFPNSLSNIESKYTGMSNYTINTDDLMQSMNDTINKFMADANELLMNNEQGK